MSKKGKKDSRVFLTDFILTKASFEPKLANGTKVELKGARIKGVVACRKGSDYGIRLGPGFTFTTHLKGVLHDPEGYWIERKDFDLIREVKKVNCLAS